jgi:hypothetical protein
VIDRGGVFQRRAVSQSLFDGGAIAVARGAKQLLVLIGELKGRQDLSSGKGRNRQEEQRAVRNLARPIQAEERVQNGTISSSH